MSVAASALIACMRETEDTKREVCPAHAAHQSLYELPSDRKRANTQCSVWKMGKWWWRMASTRVAPPGPRLAARSHTCNGWLDQRTDIKRRWTKLTPISADS
jgi:hypothetical protein